LFYEQILHIIAFLMIYTPFRHASMARAAAGEERDGRGPFKGLRGMILIAGGWLEVDDYRSSLLPAL